MTRAKEYEATETTKIAPTHPGEILREDVLPALDMSVAEAAKALKVSRQTLHRILAGTMAVSPEMAVRLANSAATVRVSGCVCRQRMTCGVRRNACVGNLSVSLRVKLRCSAELPSRAVAAGASPIETAN